ncbi:MAG: ribosome silencing factor, partial [Actinobacteria bacterium]|nr:ribosome silencing factor [Actinomycetota bacterium]
AWVLLDYSDLVVHIQSKELRSYYLLDRLWNDCPAIDLALAESKR